LNLEKIRPIVSFVGGQNTSYFAPHANVPTANLVAGTLAHSLRSDLPQVSFYDAYHEVYGLGEPLKAGDDIATQVAKTTAYWNAKLFFNASLCIRNRDRFVIFLKRKLGQRFHLVGNGWERAYGIATAAAFPTAEDYFNHFREAAVNLNLVNGNAETGLNMRHFEITAAGGFMLCYHQPELEEHFEIGRECDVFRDEQELLQKIQYYLGHADERASIARAGQRRTLSEHCYSHRISTLVELLRGEGILPKVPNPQAEPEAVRA
jgi:spore maturation protein CgeB